MREFVHSSYGTRFALLGGMDSCERSDRRPAIVVLTISVVCIAIMLAAGSACGSGSCGLEPGKWSTANSGGLCQANYFGSPERAVYCGEQSDGTYECACGAAADNPKMFVSDDFCDLKGEERLCEAVAQCGWEF